MSGIRQTISLCLTFAFFVFSFAGISAADTFAVMSDERLSEEDTGDFEDSQERKRYWQWFRKENMLPG